MLDDIPIMNPVRDKAWEKWIKRKTVVAFMKDKQGFKFPLDGSFDVWCVAWEQAWEAGFKAGYESIELEKSNANRKPFCWYHPVSGRFRTTGTNLPASWIPLYKD